MSPNGFLTESPPRVGRMVRRASTAELMGAVHERLANAERELRIQFIRIAQLQAQLDLVLGALRRTPDGAHMR